MTDEPKMSEREKRARARNPSSEKWRGLVKASALKLTDALKEKYCAILAETGRKYASAHAIGVSNECIRRHREADEEFDEMCEAAMGAYADKVHALATKLMEGVKKPIIGGKDKDEIVAHEIVHATNLVAMELKRTNPEYKERSEVDLKGNGGAVLIAPPGMTPEEWVKAQQDTAEKTKDPREAS